MNRKDYIGMFDTLKGILMIMVIFAHHIHMMDILSGSQWLNSITQVLLKYQIVPMAIFFIITGYDFHPVKTLKTYILRQARVLLIPYALSVSIAAFLNLVTGMIVGDLRIQRATVILAGGLYGCIRNTEIFGISATSVIALWFLPTLFLGGLILQIIYRIGDEWIRTFTIILITVIAISMPEVDRFQAPWFIIQSCASLGFLEAGRRLKIGKWLYRPFHIGFYIAATLLLLLGTFFSESNVGDNVYKYWVLDYLIGIISGVMIIKIYISCDISGKEWKIIGLLEYFGRYSLYVLCIHAVEMLVLPWYEYNIMEFAPEGMIIFGGVILFIIRVLVIGILCKSINRILNRSYYKRK